MLVTQRGIELYFNTRDSDPTTDLRKRVCDDK